MEELGDHTLTRLLRRMRQLLGDDTKTDTPLQELSLQPLPPTALMVLASTAASTTLDAC